MVIGIEASHAVKSERTGVEEYCFQIIQNLKKVIPPEVRVILYTNKLNDHQDQRSVLFQNLPPNWSVKVLFWPFGKLWSQMRLSWEFLWNAPDIFFAPGQLIPFITPRRTVVTIHDSSFLVFPQAYNFLGRQYLRFMNWLILFRTQKVITTSQFNIQELKRLYPWFDSNRVKAVPLSYDAKNYVATPGLDDSEVVKKCGISTPFILYVGRLETKKNTARLVEVFNIVRSNHSVQLVLVGKPGAGYTQVSAVIAGSPFKSDIIQLGYVSVGTVAALMRQARFFVLPSLYEGFGIPLLEAFASGCPALAAAVGSLPEVADKSAILVNPDDAAEFASAMEVLLVNKQERERLSEAGLKRVSFFSWKRTAEETWKIIAS